MDLFTDDLRRDPDPAYDQMRSRSRRVSLGHLEVRSVALRIRDGGMVQGKRIQ